MAKATKALDATNASRLVRADVASCQERLEEVMNGLNKLRKENEKRESHYNDLELI